MKKLILLSLVLVQTGCAILMPNARQGYKSYDPCIRCGEKWDQYPNPQVGGRP